MVTKAELEQCFHGENIILCLKNVLSTVEDPSWLGLKWVPDSKLLFQHSHVRLPRCPTLRPLINLGGYRYLLTTLSLEPLGVYHFPCKYSFPFQSTGFGSCASKISIHFPLFTEGQFQFIPWYPSSAYNNSIFVTPNFKIAAPLALDHSTLKSLNDTYNTIDSDLTRRLQTVRDDINNFSTDSNNLMPTVLVYFSLSLSFTCFNLVLLLVFYCLCLSNRPIPSTQTDRQTDR